MPGRGRCGDLWRGAATSLLAGSTSGGHSVAWENCRMACPDRQAVTADFLGNPVTGASPAQLAAIDHFVGGLISCEARVARVLDLADTEQVMVAVYTGILH